MAGKEQRYRMRYVDASKPRVIENGTKGPDSLARVVLAQVDKIIQFRLHESLGLTEEQYRESLQLPESMSQPPEYAGRFDVPLVVDSRIRLQVLRERLFIDQMIPDHIRPFVPVPDYPYLAWVHDGKRYLGQSVLQARRSFSRDEVGSTMKEVVFLFLQKPSLFRNRGAHAAGTQIGMGHVPYLQGKDQRPMRIGMHSPRARLNYFGSISRGEMIIRLGPAIADN